MREWFASLAWHLLVLCIGVGAAGYTGWTKGVEYGRNKLLAEQAATQRDAQAAYRKDVATGITDAAALIKERKQHAANYRALESKFKAITQAVPLIASRSADPAATTVTVVASCPDGSTVTQILLVPVPASSEGAGDDHLSLGAVWVWNSALIGTDTVGAYPCGADAATGQPDPACAASSGVTLAQAWANHAANAESCADDRLRHQRLIDHLQRRQKGTEAP